MKRALFVLLFLPLARPLFAQSPVQQPAQPTGNISGTIVDSSGASVAKVQVTLSSLRESQSPAGQTVSDASGQFSFTGVMAGSYQLSFTAKGFTPKSIQCELNPGQTVSLPDTALKIAGLVSNIDVTQTQAEVAEEQIHLEEKQRLVGVLPNYYVNYPSDAVPLNARQKLELNWKTVFDPTAFLITGVIAGVQQVRNNYGEFGQGTEGYAKRYGSSYATFFSASLLTNVVFPTILKQDPRYFYKGTGTRRSRFFYAISHAVICRGDNRRDQFCYSSILGELASGGISNLYYPDKERDGAGLTFENAAFGIAGNALGNLFQEFFSRKLTPKKP